MLIRGPAVLSGGTACLNFKSSLVNKRNLQAGAAKIVAPLQIMASSLHDASLSCDPQPRSSAGHPKKGTPHFHEVSIIGYKLTTSLLSKPPMVPLFLSYYLQNWILSNITKCSLTKHFLQMLLRSTSLAASVAMRTHAAGSSRHGQLMTSHCISFMTSLHVFFDQ